ncbi:MAG: ornithine cyclodeaminase family protein [Micromonosporaceae bacterium]|nr:ornithine cyclodeaminase family protein [Micromonosporaceae bacterium]
MRIIDSAQVRRVLDLATAYESQVEAFRCLGSGLADLPDRIILEGTGADAVSFCYAARLRPGTGAVCKFGAVAAGNAQLGLPSVHAMVVALHPVTGVPVAIVDGEALTELRTAAASALAVDRLSIPDAATLAVVGCGVQGRAHVRALAARRRYRQIRLFDHTPGHAEAARDDLTRDDLAPLPLSVAPSVAEAVAGAEVVVLCTTSSEPMLEAAWVAPGATVVSIGSFERSRCEVAPSFVAGVDQVVVDHKPIALRQAGPVVAAIAEGMDPARVADLGELVAQDRPGRDSPHQTVFYNSVGLGVQDAAAVWAILGELADA